MLTIVDYTEELVDETRDMKLGEGNSLAFSIELLGEINEFYFVEGTNLAETTMGAKRFIAEFSDGEKVELNLLDDRTVMVELTRTTGEVITDHNVMISCDILLSIDDEELVINKKKLHPLLNKDSTHYNDRKDQVSTIEKMERRYSIQQMIDWSNITIFKYEDRKDFKNQKESDIYKIETYRDYVDFLEELKVEIVENAIVADAYSALNIEIIYEVK